MIIDCHTHINNYHNESQESLSEDLGRLQKEMRRNRVDIALVLTSYKVNPGRPSIRAVVEATRSLPNLHVVAGICYATFAPGDLVEIRDFILEGTVRGLKLYPGYEPFYPADLKLEPLYRLAAECDVPVMIHSGDTYSPRAKIKYAHPLHVDDVAVDYPEVTFVICHIGNPWIRDCMEVVFKNKNVYTDISGLVLGDFKDRFQSFMMKQLQEMLLFGVEPTKVLFGSDWPISSMESYLRFMDDLAIPSADKRKILFENTARLFKLNTSDSGLRRNSFVDRLK